MATDLKWVEVLIGDRIASDKHELNLTQDEVITLQDLTPTRVPGSMSLRKFTEIAVSSPSHISDVKRIGQQNRPDGDRVFAAAAKPSAASQYRLHVTNPDDNTWETAFGSVPNLNLGTEGADLAITPDAIRACGEDGLAVVVKLGTLPYMDGDTEVMPRQFIQANGRQAEDFIGVGYVVWDGKVRSLFPEIASLPDDGVIIRLNLLSQHIETNTQGVSSWFGGDDYCYYYYTLTFEGGQESPPVFVAEIQSGGDTEWIRVEVEALRSIQFPFAIKTVNIYRKKPVEQRREAQSPIPQS